MEATATVQGPKKIRIIAPANNIQKTTARDASAPRGCVLSGVYGTRGTTQQL